MIIKTVAEIKVTDTIVVRGEKFLVDSISDKNNIPNIPRLKSSSVSSWLFL